MRPPSIERRTLLKTLGQGLLAAPALSALAQTPEHHPPATLASSPTAKKAARPKLVLDIRDFGAKGDGAAKDTAAIQQAIDRCGVLGGGEVLVPAGNFLTGAIQLRSHVLLRLDKDATLTGTPDFDDYPVTQVRWEGKWIQGHTALVYAIDATNTGIVGPGRIIGNNALGGRPAVPGQPARWGPSPLRHPALIEPINCSHLRFEDFSTSYRLMWSLHPTCCRNIVIKNLTIRSTGGNGDGIDIDSCQHVLIDGCDIATGDDCISLKSGRGAEAYAQLDTTEDVSITNCTFADSIFACIGIGSETSGGIRNVRIDRCRFTGAKTFAFYIKSRPGRGAFIEDIVATNLDVKGAVGGFLRINILNSGLQDQNPVPGDEGIPTIRNFRFMNIHVDDVPVLVDATSIHPHKPLLGFTLASVTGTCRRGIALANIKNAVLRDIRVTGYEGPLLSIASVTGAGLAGAAKIDPPRVPDPVPEPATPYKLH